MSTNDQYKLEHWPTIKSASWLLGKYLEHSTPAGKIGGYIVETEAYLGIKDAAAHSYQERRTPRLEAMYQEAGTLYLYTMHTHLMLNIITQPAGIPEGILIRGIEPVIGLDLMEQGRSGRRGIELSNGPGKLTKAFHLKADLNGQDVWSSSLKLNTTDIRQPAIIESSPRIGIPNKGKWTEAKLRYYVKTNPYVSYQKRTAMNWETYGWERQSDQDETK